MPKQKPVMGYQKTTLYQAGYHQWKKLYSTQLARIFHQGWPEGGSRPAMARRGVQWSGVQWSGEHSGSMESGPFETVTQPGRSMGPHNGYPS
uniref:Uncharacterized protein n=1 Tax=Magnetococcus massalia (strain MO-1) TaxID=451514 RepID=A0A1S7LKK5_MAGMO|nr:protein of unknown function [Candidatus Magnetococcus massalia]